MPAFETLPEAMDISCTTAWVAVDLLKALVILPDITVGRSAVDQEDIKPTLKIRKNLHSLAQSKSLLFIGFSTILLTAERRQAGL